MYGVYIKTNIHYIYIFLLLHAVTIYYNMFIPYFLQTIFQQFVTLCGNKLQPLVNNFFSSSNTFVPVQPSRTVNSKVTRGINSVPVPLSTYTEQNSQNSSTSKTNSTLAKYSCENKNNLLQQEVLQASTKHNKNVKERPNSNYISRLNEVKLKCSTPCPVESNFAELYNVEFRPIVITEQKQKIQVKQKVIYNSKQVGLIQEGEAEPSNIAKYEIQQPSVKPTALMKNTRRLAIKSRCLTKWAVTNTLDQASTNVSKCAYCGQNLAVNTYT